ncbi:hypothetical protein PDE_04883 [Penicillium oxalicum 114-2]|uniref:Uncharacterized protein n=1 Tax=Penicillium oxalicum (strain 114-2 / CGMCC 5302) TaxID=933388 RepID=S8AUU2_PENO1|nr:hypothetical protein PDE_04883 [Penicillium oxalicum 114-2]
MIQTTPLDAGCWMLGSDIMFTALNQVQMVSSLTREHRDTIAFDDLPNTIKRVVETAYRESLHVQNVRHCWLSRGHRFFRAPGSISGLLGIQSKIHAGMEQHENLTCFRADHCWLHNPPIIITHMALTRSDTLSGNNTVPDAYRFRTRLWRQCALFSGATLRMTFTGSITGQFAGYDNSVKSISNSTYKAHRHQNLALGRGTVSSEETAVLIHLKRVISDFDVLIRRLLPPRRMQPKVW